MKIAQIAPLYESVPPKFYGGTERIVHYLTEELVSQGHEVTLFASGDSESNATLISNVGQALRLNKDCIDPMAHHIVQLQEVIERCEDFDILHFHTDYLHFPFTRNLNLPCVTTLHGRLDIPDLQPVYNKFPEEPVIAISENQKKPLPQANWIGTVYHGLPPFLHQFDAIGGNYLAFIGRVSPEKGIDRAIEIAIAAGIPLKIAAKVDKADTYFYETAIRPLLNHPLIEFIGEINESQKTGFLGQAMALLFPINWPEPFGLAMIESMACGTPVIAFRGGSVDEVMTQGRTGFIVESIPEAVEAISKIKRLSRADVRLVFEERFTAPAMAGNYLKLYELVVQLHQKTKQIQSSSSLFRNQKNTS